MSALPLRPGQPDSIVRGLLPALACHALLVWALAFGVSWRSHDEGGVAEAELWAAVPQIAAPRAQQPPEPEPPKPEPVKPPKPEPKPEPDRAAEQQQQQRLAEIAERREREEKKKREAEAERKRQAEAREARERREEQARKEREKERAEQRAEERAEKAEAARREAQRQENLRRIQGLAGASGGPTATGNAMQSAGPSAGYAGRIKARIKPNITLPDLPPGNPQAEVEVRTAPDGLIVSRRLVKPSGNSAWDEAVLRAIDKTERLPRDTDGRVPPVLVISFRPND